MPLNCRNPAARGKITRSFNRLTACRAENPDPQFPADQREALAAQAKNVYIRRN
jgi:hypothetical protein